MATRANTCARVIAGVMGSIDPRRLDAKQMKELRKRLRAAYPFGERANWPYKVWCREVRRALMLKPRPLPTEHEPDQLWLDFVGANDERETDAERHGQLRVADRRDRNALLSAVGSIDQTRRSQKPRQARPSVS